MGELGNAGSESYPNQTLLAARAGDGGVDVVGARSAKDDWRMALHESGHVIVARVLGVEIGGVTIVPGPTYGGLTWGPAYERSELSDNDQEEAPNRCAKIGSLMPGPGEPRKDAVEIVAHAHHRIIELMGGTAAEALLHADDPPWEARSDLTQARALARIICTSEESIEALICFGYEEALSIIGKHRGLVTALANALISHPERTLNGKEIDVVIAETLEREARAAERDRRAAWERTVENAGNFNTSLSK
jgi:ATP-dependent Zn protease